MVSISISSGGDKPGLRPQYSIVTFDAIVAPFTAAKASCNPKTKDSLPKTHTSLRQVPPAGAGRLSRR